MEVKPDNEDSGFTGTGDYIFKVARYTSSGSGPTWSNETTIKIISTSSDTQTSTLAKISPTSSNTPTPSTTKVVTTTSSPKTTSQLTYRIASVAGITTGTASATSSANIEIKNQKQINPVLWIGLISVFAGAGSLGYIYWKKKRR